MKKRTPEEQAANAEYQRRYRERQRELNRKSINFWLTADESKQVKAFLAGLRAEEEEARWFRS